MTFLDIIRSPFTNLPIKPDPKKSFRELVKEKFEQFGDLIDNSSDLSSAVNGIEFTETIFKRKNKVLRDGIISTINTYYEGRPSEAYHKLAEFMKKSGVSGYLTKDFYLDKKTDLYRLRVADGNYPLDSRDLFHIPFQLREKVKTQRYSIPGLPSLYLSNSVFVAWEEMKRPSFNRIQAMRLSNQRDFSLLDLTTDIFARNGQLVDNTSYGWQLLYKVMAWPLLAACSIKVKHSDDPFKPEYIILQLLMQWINKEKVDGIRYSSTHIDMNDEQHDGSFYNIAFPVKTFDADHGYCKVLVKAFKSTSVLPMELRQFVSHSDRLGNQESISTAVNPSIKSIELIQGMSQSYMQTMFGILEHSLKGLVLNKIDC